MKTSVSNRQIILIIFGSIVGYGILHLPKDVVTEAGTASWISISIATIIAMVGVYIYTFLGLTFPGKTIAQYSEILVGRLFTKLIILAYIIYFLIITAMVIRISSEVIRLTILIKTPVVAIAFFLTLITLYGVTRGLGSIALIMEFYGIVIIIFFFVINIVIFTQGELLNLRPILGKKDIGTYISAVPTSVLSFLGIELIMVIPLENLQKKKTYFYNLGMMFLIGIIYMATVESVLSVLGEDTIIYHKDTILAAIRRISARGLQIFRRIDGFFLVAWILTIFSTVLMYAYGTIYLVNECSKIYFKKSNFNTLAFIVMIICFIVTMMPETLLNTELVFKYIGYFSVITLVVIPTILFLAIKVKKYDKKTN